MNMIPASAMTRSEVIQCAIDLMLQGMGGIFLVMAAICGIVWLITKFTK